MRQEARLLQQGPRDLSIATELSKRIVLAKSALLLSNACVHSTFNHLPYQRPRPYQPPPPSSRMTNAMMRRVVISIVCLPLAVHLGFPRTPLDALQH